MADMAALVGRNAALLDALNSDTSLDHQSNQIGNEGAKPIGEALKSNTTLTSMNLGGNSIDTGTVAALEDRMADKKLLQCQRTEAFTRLSCHARLLLSSVCLPTEIIIRILEVPCEHLLTKHPYTIPWQ